MKTKKEGIVLFFCCFYGRFLTIITIMTVAMAIAIMIPTAAPAM
jgi:hypothetical protein